MDLIDPKGTTLRGGFYYKELEVLPLVYLHSLTLFGVYLNLQDLERFVPSRIHSPGPSEAERSGYRKIYEPHR